MPMSRLSKGLLAAFIIAFGIAAAAQIRTTKPAGVLQKTKAYRFNKIRDDVYHAVGTGALTVGSNSSIIINDNDVTLVDTHISPAAAWVLIDELKAITTKPVRYVIITHFHYDHAHGAQIFGDGVEVIEHEFTREVLQNDAEGKTYKGYITGLPQSVETLRGR